MLLMKYVLPFLITIFLNEPCQDLFSLFCLCRFVQAEADLATFRKKCQELETLENKLLIDLAQANDDKEVQHFL